MNQAVTGIPAGYMQNAIGHLVPLESIKPIDIERDALVKRLHAKAMVVSEVLAKLKAEMFDEIEAFETLAAEQYGANLGGQKGNLTLTSYDGRIQVQRCMQETLGFDEGLQIARSLIGECVHDWSEGTRAELKTLIMGAFTEDSEGRLNARRILSLRKHNIADERWQRAMSALSDSVRVQNCKAYVRVRMRLDDRDGWATIPLDIAGA